MPLITLGFEFDSLTQVTPANLHRVVDEAVVTDFAPGDFVVTNKTPTYGNTRPALERGAMHYDTSVDLEGLVFAFVSASHGSVSAWLHAVPRRECMCWTASSLTYGTPVFIGRPGYLGDGPEYVTFDGCMFPSVWQYTAPSGPDAAMFITMESAGSNHPVKCMWAGMVPSRNMDLLRSSSSQASIGNPLFVDFSNPASFKAGNPTPRNFIFGVNLSNTPEAFGAIIWGTGPAIEDLGP